MSRLLPNARFAAALAVAAIVFSGGLVAGAAGDPLILGSQFNNSGSSGTKVSSSVNGNAFAVAQTGAGTSANGIRGDASSGSGGVFTSSTNNALFATAASGNRFAMVAVSNGGAGTGGALFADGNANPAIDIQTNGGVPPMTVNSSTVVSSLNSDMVDGLHGTAFHRYDSTVPFGATMTGVFQIQGPDAAAAGETYRQQISFPVPTLLDLTPHVIEPGAAVPAGCSGSLTSPDADAGHLCIFVGVETNISAYSVFNPVDASDGASRFGAYLRATSAAAGEYRASGTWAATGNIIFIPLSEGAEGGSDLPSE